jgi:hypothetical protein
MNQTEFNHEKDKSNFETRSKKGFEAFEDLEAEVKAIEGSLVNYFRLRFLELELSLTDKLKNLGSSISKALIVTILISVSLIFLMYGLILLMQDYLGLSSGLSFISISILTITILVFKSKKDNDRYTRENIKKIIKYNE